MPQPSPVQNDPIDAVITWVDGNDPAHQIKRRAYMEGACAPLHENATNPHRWQGSDEILYCLRSIAANAPWLRTIWIVVDEAAPDLSSLPSAVTAKVQIAYHKDIFAGFTHVLPTFNSLAIESMLWRIEGLSERFLYFNDDVFLTAPLVPGDLFQGAAPVLRGKWANYSALANDADARADPAKFNHFMQINAAQIMGFSPDHLFAAAHVVHPMLRSTMAQLFDRSRPQFLSNIAHRFRDLDQFLPQGLHNHACIAQGCAVISTAADHLHIYSGQGNGRAPSETRQVLAQAISPEIKFLCINDLPQLEALIPDARDVLNRAIGGLRNVAV